jgi:hypothetical protein
MTDTFNDPGTGGGGDKLPLTDLKGSLLLVTVYEHLEPIATEFGPTRAIRADVAALDGALKGSVYADTLIFPKKLQSQLSSSVGGKVIGRLGQGEKQPGKNPPWQLEAATDGDKEIGRKYLAHVEAQTPAPARGGGSVTLADEEPFVRDATVTDL